MGRPIGNDLVEDILVHYGVKGMKWGVRKDAGASAASASADHVVVSKHLQKAKAAGVGTKALSNKELQEVVNRMNLEQQYSRLNPKKSPIKNGHAFVKDGLAIFGTVSAVYAATQSPMAKQIATQLKKS